MADYYTQFSIGIRLDTPAEIAWWQKVKDIQSDDWNNYDGANEGSDAWMAQRKIPIPDGGGERIPGCTIELENTDQLSSTTGTPQVWLYTEEGGDLDLVCLMIQIFLKEFKLGDVITLAWAETCSRPRYDAFGGGAVVITAKGAKWMSTSQFIEDKKNSRSMRGRSCRNMG